jgi:hypothetical protein
MKVVSIPLSSLHGLQRDPAQNPSSQIQNMGFHTAKQSSRSATTRFTAQWPPGARIASFHTAKQSSRSATPPLENQFHSNPKRPFPLIPLGLGSLPAAKGPFQGWSFGQS